MKMKSLLDDIQRVKVSALRMHPKNPRKGDVDIIAASLESNGQFRPLVVQKSSDYIIAGNHTLRAAKKLGWKTIDVTYIDVDDHAAKKILLVDNRSQDAAGYDYELLAEIISEMPDMEGTGYSDTDRDFLTQSIEAAQEDTTKTVADLVHETPSFGIIEPKTEAELIIDASAGEEGASGLLNPNPDEDETFQSLDDVSSELEGILELKENITWPIKNYWGIPELDPTKLLDRKDLPDPLRTWGGREATPDDGVSTYWYNYGVDSARELPWDRSILGFYTHDIHFENWWRVPAHYTAKVMNAGIEIVSSPNFSMWADEPRMLQMWQVYRARWMGRYFQEAGMKLIPDVNWSNEESLNWCLEGIPKGLSIMSIQLQTINRHDKKDMAELRSGVKKIVDELKPEALIVYSGKTGHKEAKALNLPCELILLQNRATVRRGVVFDTGKGYDITKEKVKASGPNKASVAEY